MMMTGGGVNRSKAEEIPAELLQDLTSNERRNLIGYADVEEADANKSILADRLGVGGTEAMVSVIQSPDIPDGQKQGLLSVLFGLTDDQINTIMNRHDENR